MGPTSSGADLPNPLSASFCREPTSWDPLQPQASLWFRDSSASNEEIKAQGASVEGSYAAHCLWLLLFLF